MTITLEPLRIGGTATLTHYLVSFCQTVFHQRLGHRRLGGKLFRNHIRWHHVYYAGDHMVSEKYLAEQGNNTPFFLIPVAAVAVAAWSFMPLDLFVTHPLLRWHRNASRTRSLAIYLIACTSSRGRTSFR